MNRRYTVLDVLGRGGFGAVYLCRFEGVGGFAKEVAVKVLLPRSDDDRNADSLRRLRDEARLLGMLNHSAIVGVDRLVPINGEWAVVMDYVPGVDGQTLMSRGGIPARVGLEMAAELADALDHAWRALGPEGKPLRLLHRDIKPSNFLVAPDGGLKVLDFGIARAEFLGREAKTGDVGFGTPAYMAPERFRGIEDPAGDVYSLGCVLWGLLKGEGFGRPPFSGFQHQKFRDNAMNSLYSARPDVPVGALTLVARMLDFEIEARPTAREVAGELLALADQLPPPSLRAWAREVVPKFRAERRPSKSPEIGTVLHEHSESALEVSGEIPLAPSVKSVAPLIVAVQEKEEIQKATRPPVVISKAALESTADPVGVVAAQRESGPSEAVAARSTGVESAATSSDPAPPAPTTTGRASRRAAFRWAVLLGAGLPLGLGLVALVGVQVWRGSDHAVEDHPPAPITEDAVVKATSEPPELVAVPGPEVGGSDTPPARSSEPARAARAARTSADPSARTSSTAPTRATVRAQGASSVTLVRGAEVYPVPGPVPEGTWQIKAIFKTSPEDAGSVVVPASGTVSLICERSTRLCKGSSAEL